MNLGMWSFIIMVFQALAIVTLLGLFLSKRKDSTRTKQLLASVRDILVALENGISEVSRSAERASSEVSSNGKKLSAQLLDHWSQVKVIAINGTIEATKDPEVQRKIQRYFDEISKVVSEARKPCLELESLGKSSETVLQKIKDLDDLLARVADDAVVFSPRLTVLKKND